MTFKLYKVLFKQSLKETFMYKTTTVLTVIFGVLFYAIDIVAGMVYFSFSKDIYGWKMIDYLNLITTANLITYGYQFLFVASHENLADEIIEGNLDQFLIRPVNSFLFYITYRVDFPSLVNFIITAIVECIILTCIGINPLDLLIYLTYVVLGIVFLFAANQIATTLAFWFPNLTAIQGIPEYLSEMGKKPSQIYPRIIQAIFALVFPILLITNVPIYSYSNKLKFVVGLWILFMDIFLIAVAYIEWLLGLKHYESAN